MYYIGIQETQLEDFKDIWLDQIGYMQDFFWYVLPSQGRSEGILTDKRCYILTRHTRMPEHLQSSPVVSSIHYSFYSHILTELGDAQHRYPSDAHVEQSDQRNLAAGTLFPRPGGHEWTCSSPCDLASPPHPGSLTQIDLIDTIAFG
jgi:hypothetical protein